MTCLIITDDCVDPGAAPENGQKTGETYTHGSIVTYTCNDGYTLSGPGGLTCTAGDWDNDVPTCNEETAAGSSVAPTTKADSDSSPGENGAGVARFDYLMIPAVILALFSN
ncbi:complement decay-accelerating factor-like [Ptychodera flava]|uniref:complement decay-accelerating factor-like n=1 Tax=Ptychodera flava TaxID=63121 RepID=UPI00396A13AE